MSGVPPPWRAAAVILAAGASSRMGGPKALLDFGGETAVGRILRVLGAARVEHRIVVVDPRRQEVVRAVTAPGVTQVENPDPATGQTASIRLGLARLPEDAETFLLCPVDVPLFEPGDLLALQAAYERRRPETRIVVPTCAGRRGHPVLCSRSLAAEFLALGPDEPGHRVIRRDPGRILHLETNNRELVTDLDTPGEYRAAVERLLARQRAESGRSP